jgi:hypothetical protein
MASILAALAQSRYRHRGPRVSSALPEISDIKTIQDAVTFMLIHVEYQERNIGALLSKYESKVPSINTIGKRLDLLDEMFGELQSVAQTSILPVLESISIMLPMLIEWYAEIDASKIAGLNVLFHSADEWKPGEESKAMEFNQLCNVEGGLKWIGTELVNSGQLLDSTSRRFVEFLGRWGLNPETETSPIKKAPTLKERADSLFGALVFRNKDKKLSDLDGQLFVERMYNTYDGRIRDLCNEFGEVLSRMVDAVFKYDLLSAESAESAKPVDSAAAHEVLATPAESGAKKTKEQLTREIEKAKDAVSKAPIGLFENARKGNRIKIFSLQIEVDAEGIVSRMTSVSREAIDLSFLQSIETEIMNLESKGTKFFGLLLSDLQKTKTQKEDYDHNARSFTINIANITLHNIVKPYNMIDTILRGLERKTAPADAEIQKILDRTSASRVRLGAHNQLVINAANDLFDSRKTEFGRVAVTKNRRTGRGNVHNRTYCTRFGEYVHRAAKHSVRVPPRAWSA